MALLKTIDLNCDLGELLEGQLTNLDHEIMPFISSCNIACGFHSGTPQLIEHTIKLAIKNNVAIGAHPSYNDRKNFGRKSLDISMNKLKTEVKHQVCLVKDLVASLGEKLHHVKPHGALYNDMASDYNLSLSILETIASIDNSLFLYGLAHSETEKACQMVGLQFIGEAFADRRYDNELKLVNRKIDNAVLHQSKEIINQLDGIINKTIKDNTEKVHPINAQTICLHSDTPNAVNLADEIYQYLKVQNIEITAP